MFPAGFTTTGQAHSAPFLRRQKNMNSKLASEISVPHPPAL